MDHVSMMHAELARELGRISQLEGEREILGRRTLKLEAELAAEKNAHESDCHERDRRWAMAKEANERVAVLEAVAADIRAAIAKRETWTSGPEALELLAQELEREAERTGA